MRIGKTRRSALAPDMTPMIDVVFLLLIFFLTTSQLAELASSELELPREPGSKEKQGVASGLVVNIGPDGTITILDEMVALETLPAIVRAALFADADSVPVVRADRMAQASRLNEVMDALRSGGCRSVRLATVTREEVEP